MDGLDNNVERIERVLKEFHKGTQENERHTPEDSRRAPAPSSCIEPDTSISLAQTFEVVADQCPAETKRTLGTVTLRLLGTEDVLPETSNE